ncbi:MAG: hypothetical protein ACTSPD_07305 [Promethearchaeota archaeon]
MVFENYLKNFRSVINKINQIVDALGEFKYNYDKKFNFSKIAKYLMIPNSEINNIISLILNFQEKFENVFQNYRIKKKIVNNQIYLILEPVEKEKRHPKTKSKKIPKKIYFNQIQAKLISDLIYMFKHIKKGKGFDLSSSNNSNFFKNIKLLKKEHNFLFEVKNGLIYPSEIAIQLGDLIIAYYKTNRNIETINLGEFQFNFS